MRQYKTKAPRTRLESRDARRTALPRSLLSVCAYLSLIALVELGSMPFGMLLGLIRLRLW